nr:hypothetical protein [Paraburkholderia sp. BL8N3]
MNFEIALALEYSGFFHAVIARRIKNKPNPGVAILRRRNPIGIGWRY